MSAPKRYLVEIRPPEAGDRYWCEGTIRRASGTGVVDDELDEQPVIIAELVEVPAR